MALTQGQQERGAVLVAAGVSPFLINLLAAKIHADRALDILELALPEQDFKVSGSVDTNAVDAFAGELAQRYADALAHFA